MADGHLGRARAGTGMAPKRGLPLARTLLAVAVSAVEVAGVCSRCATAPICPCDYVQRLPVNLTLALTLARPWS
jgi:hypothetical protein